MPAHSALEHPVDTCGGGEAPAVRFPRGGHAACETMPALQAAAVGELVQEIPRNAVASAAPGPQ